MLGFKRKARKKTIDFCIPFVAVGFNYTEFLISNLLSTAAYPNRITISLSVHTQTDKELIQNSSLSKLVKNIVVSPAYAFSPDESSDDTPFVSEGVIGSANHCRAVQSLCDRSTADVVIFSDHDMAFLVHEWDLKIVKTLDDYDLCGVGYPNYQYQLNQKKFPKFKFNNMGGYNYLNIPNLSFLAISQKCLKTYFAQGISSAHHYLANGGLPLQIVNTIQMANALHLPVGAVWIMDSGFEIPFVIQDNGLRYQTFFPVTFDQQDVFSSNVFTESASTGNLPMVFIDGVTGEPLLAHYVHGTRKGQNADNKIPFDCFVVAVNNYLSK